MYQPTLGHFLSRDPLSENGVDVLTDAGFYADRLAAMRANPWHYGGNYENPYLYVRNNPTNRVDPSGWGSGDAQRNPIQLPPSMQGCKCRCESLSTPEEFFNQHPGFGATTACVKGQFVPIINWKLIGPAELLCGILDCRVIHEQRMADLMKAAGCKCPSVFGGRGKIPIMGWTDQDCTNKSECYAHQQGLACLSRMLASASLACTAVILKDIERILGNMKEQYDCNKYGIGPIPPGVGK
jgi:hypothetical protein